MASVAESSVVVVPGTDSCSHRATLNAASGAAVRNRTILRPCGGSRFGGRARPGVRGPFAARGACGGGDRFDHQRAGEAVELQLGHAVLEYGAEAGKLGPLVAVLGLDQVQAGDVPLLLARAGKGKQYVRVLAVGRVWSAS